MALLLLHLAITTDRVVKIVTIILVALTTTARFPGITLLPYEGHSSKVIHHLSNSRNDTYSRRHDSQRGNIPQSSGRSSSIKLYGGRGGIPSSPKRKPPTGKTLAAIGIVPKSNTTPTKKLSGKSSARGSGDIPASSPATQSNSSERGDGVIPASLPVTLPHSSARGYGCIPDTSPETPNIGSISTTQGWGTKTDTGWPKKVSETSKR